uniref:Uncharacterized protein n=1 Tax=Anguilla anguilla TaxID=7936 RepID=A0A0E9V698_ANGAN
MYMYLHDGHFCPGHQTQIIYLFICLIG